MGYIYDDYKDVVKFLCFKFGLTKRLKAKTSGDIIYSIGNILVVLKDYDLTLSKDFEIKRLRAELKKSANN